MAETKKVQERISTHSQVVRNVLASKRCHLTAEEILEEAEGVSTATVYRALEQLTEKGMIRRLSLGKKSAVYEYVRDTHMHFVCRVCGDVFDIPLDLTGMASEAAQCYGHTTESCDVTIHGVCRDCTMDA